MARSAPAPGESRAPLPVVAVGAIVVRDARLLLVRRGHQPEEGKWAVPGGRVEPGERVRDAVEREVAEETGVTVRCGELLGWAERIDTGFHYVILDFEASPVCLVEARPGDDASEARWVPLAEVGDLDLVEGMGEFLKTHGILDDAGRRR
ncbi:MAG: NUDIX hydrolase [Acidimicrobiales bacterium]